MAKVIRNTYRLTGRGKVGYKLDGGPLVIHRPGDILELSREEAERFGSRVERFTPSADVEVRTASGGTSTDDASDQETTLNPETEDGKTDWAVLVTNPVPFVLKAIKEIESIPDLRALIEAEQEGRNRTSVVTTANARITEIEDGE